MSDASLKRLGFVTGYAAQASSLAGSLYVSARTFVPGVVEPYVQQAEETALTFTAPYVTLAQDKAEKVLSTLDTQVSRGGSSSRRRRMRMRSSGGRR
jgi:hypothetical protein